MQADGLALTAAAQTTALRAPQSLRALSAPVLPCLPLSWLSALYAAVNHQHMSRQVGDVWLCDAVGDVWL